MKTLVSRRSFLRSALLVLAAPAIVRASSLMAIKPLPAPGVLAVGRFGSPITVTKGTLTVIMPRWEVSKFEEVSWPPGKIALLPKWEPSKVLLKIT